MLEALDDVGARSGSCLGEEENGEAVDSCGVAPGTLEGNGVVPFGTEAARNDSGEAIAREANRVAPSDIRTGPGWSTCSRVKRQVNDEEYQRRRATASK